MNQIRNIWKTPMRGYINVFRYYSKNLYEPDYLEAMKSKIPLYDVLNIQMKGYDYPVLEKFQKLIHNLAKTMEINIEDGWALPYVELSVSTYKPNSEIVESKYDLKVYRRTIQVTDVTSVQLPLLLRTLEACTPAGVTVEVVNHAEHHEEERYVPDKELIDLKQTLDDMGGSKKK